MKNTFSVEVHLIASLKTNEQISYDPVHVDRSEEKTHMKRVFLHVHATDSRDLVQHERVMIDFANDRYSVSIMRDSVHVNEVTKTRIRTDTKTLKRQNHYTHVQKLDEAKFVKSETLNSKKAFRDFLRLRFDKSQRDSLMRLIHIVSEATDATKSERKAAIESETLRYKMIDLTKEQ